MIKIKTYKNGIRLVVESNKTGFISFGLGINCGSMNEKPDEYGVAHFLEHLFFKSTKSSTTEDIAKKLEGYGAVIDAYTSEEQTFFYFNTLKEHFGNCLNIYADMFFNGRFNKNEVDTEREVVIEEVKMYEDSSQTKLAEDLQETFMQNTPYSHKILGQEEIIKNISIAKIKAFKKRNYIPENMVFSIAGNISFKQAKKLVEKEFVNKFGGVNSPKCLIKKEININPNKKFLAIKKDDTQTNLIINIKAENIFSKKYYTQQLYTIMLGQGMSSRMFSYIREKQGFAYDVYATQAQTSLAKYLSLIMGTRPQNVAKCIECCRFLLDDAAINGFTKEELDKAKNNLKARLNLYKTNSSSSRKNFTQLQQYGKLISDKELLKIIKGISLEQVNDFAKQIANEKTFTVGAIGKNIKLEDLKLFNK